MIYVAIVLFVASLILLGVSYVFRVRIFNERDKSSVLSRVLSGVSISSLNDARFIDLYKVRKDLTEGHKHLVLVYAWSGFIAFVCLLAALVIFHFV